jgi:Na+/H+ antiporter NhaD/arsenite permease-like protein
MIKRAGLACLILACHPGVAWAAEGPAHFDGAPLGAVWIVPFAGILLSIAILPLAMPHFWHDHFGKVSAFWIAAFLVPFTVSYGPAVALQEVLHTILLEYIPFIILLLSLFTVTGGIRISGHLRGTPGVNTVMLLIGTLIASWMGTTGAAMLLIRPLIEANSERRHKTHVIVFFIFLVANIGGSLTPLGDPPLFLGFLKGVPFFWPTLHLLAPTIFAVVILLAIFYGIDRYVYRKDVIAPQPAPDSGDRRRRLRIEGTGNLLLLGGIVATVVMSGIWNPAIHLTVFDIAIPLQALARDVLLIIIVLASLRFTHDDHRAANAFSWFPILEVAKLFIGIFLTIIPAIAILRAGRNGVLGGVIAAVTDESGQPIDAMYFWATGILSSFLDNAPTYLVFFNTAGGDAQVLTGPLASTLTAISAGAVFMGANTYIGNAPNFMVRSIAVERGVAMPSFFGYMLWSSLVLLPLFALLTVVFFL